MLFRSRWVQVEVKAILVEQPLLGQGLLPDWLRNKKGLYALDTFDDSMCLFRCIAVHRGARPDRCTQEAIELAKQFRWWSNDQQKVLRAVELTELKKVEEKLKLGIRVYEPSEDGTWRLIRQPAHYETVGIKTMTIGWYDGHAFLIKDIKKVANIYACAHCNQQFTQATHLQRHADRCISVGWHYAIFVRN